MIEWEIDTNDIRKIKDFIDQQKSNPFVRDREKRNLEGNGFKITKIRLYLAFAINEYEEI